MFCGKFAVRSKQLCVIHGPLLNGMLFLITVMVTVGSTSEGIECVAIGVKIIPGGQLRCWDEIAFVEGTVSAVCFVREAQRMFIELCNWYHLLKVTMVREMILNSENGTAWVVTP